MCVAVSTHTSIHQLVHNVSFRPRLRLVFQWLMTAFASHLDCRELLLLWDRMIGFDSLDVIAGQALGLHCLCVQYYSVVLHLYILYTVVRLLASSVVRHQSFLGTWIALKPRIFSLFLCKHNTPFSKNWIVCLRFLALYSYTHVNASCMLRCLSSSSVCSGSCGVSSCEPLQSHFPLRGWGAMYTLPYTCIYM